MNVAAFGPTRFWLGGEFWLTGCISVAAVTATYGLLRCTSSRCVWLRQTVAALPLPDETLHSAFRRRLWIKIKSRRADTRPIEWLRAKRCSAVDLCCGYPSPRPSPEGEGVDFWAFQNLSSTRYRTSAYLCQTTRSVPSPSGRGLG